MFDAPTVTLKPRKPLFAASMSFILTGFGQLYNGQINKALWLYMIFTLLLGPMLALIALYLPSVLMFPVLALSLLACIGVWLYSMVDAWRQAKRQTQYALKPWQLSSVYVAVFVVCNLLLLPLLINYINQHQVAAFSIPSFSMEPTVLQGDWLFADKRYNCPDCKTAVQRGDIAIFTYPNNRTQYYIKRIIGLPNDQIQFKGTAINVNGKPLSQQVVSKGIISEQIDGKAWSVQWQDGQGFAEATLIVPAGQVFVLGDNRTVSQDSRDFGTVPLQDVVGKARQVWFSKAREGGAIRWERLGKVLH